jgi:hypothetical protein
MRLTVRHRFDFGSDRELVGDDLVRPEAWDALRTRTSGPFALAGTREAWERAADERPELEARARRLEAVFARHDAHRLASYGVGGATLECWLKRMAPDRDLVVGDYAPATIERLRPIFPEAECVVHDLSADPPLDADLHLFHRVETEFDNAQWREIFERFSSASIVFVAAGELDLRGALNEVRKGLRPGHARAGWARTRAAIEALWRRTHEGVPVDAGDLPAWELRPK